ncbi:serine O-acetyltransferase EpsC [Haloquadratum walsbyi]|jgi:Serine acetyltransferase|uniref:serine O-acetyltransferase n=1 Tax=Haloquadratum walsbyi J07HQW2 TaxID=1238425 RepID=U1NI39_9EURY|nr:serine O-acetyltransferase EpsC [Haloquadratum walsbyi]ERG96845.1 MAG: serine acetyltransferase [Haloquadratum walsbyi J07HQW2]
MEYRYAGDANEKLFEAYQSDADPYPTNVSVCFPEREHRRGEIAYLQELFFPTCWNAPELVRDELAILDMLDELGDLFHAGICPYPDVNANEVVTNVLDTLPEIRTLLKRDAEAAYKGDPAAKSYTEIIRSYPGFLAIAMQRVAHILYEEGAVEYARELTEYAKTQTGIDIHPGAEIGEYFFIDHGTGVVIGETVTVGDWVRLYQDVTLGALHFEEQEGTQHALKKGYERHPDIGDHVVIGAGTKVLGSVTVGDHVSIGANSWVTDDIPDHTKVYITNHPTQERKRYDKEKDAKIN